MLKSGQIISHMLKSVIKSKEYIWHMIGYLIGVEKLQYSTSS